MVNVTELMQDCVEYQEYIPETVEENRPQCLTKITDARLLHGDCETMEMYRIWSYGTLVVHTSDY